MSSNETSATISSTTSTTNEDKGTKINQKKPLQSTNCLNTNIELDFDNEIVYKSIPSDSTTYMGPPPLTKRLNIELENRGITNYLDCRPININK